MFIGTEAAHPARKIGAIKTDAHALMTLMAAPYSRYESVMSYTIYTVDREAGTAASAKGHIPKHCAFLATLNG